MTDKHAIQAVYNQIKGLSLGLNLYKHSSPEDCPDEYIVINTLPIGSGIIQKCIVNVNIHIKDIEPGKADTVRLDQLTEIVVNHFEEAVSENIYMYYQQQKTFAESALKKHYSNIRIEVIMLNE